jgi:hypothetical protein
MCSKAKSRFAILDKLENEWQEKMKWKREKEASKAEEQARQDAELLRRTFQVPEGDVPLVVPDLQDSVLEEYLFTAVRTFILLPFPPLHLYSFACLFDFFTLYAHLFFVCFF